MFQLQTASNEKLSRILQQQRFHQQQLESYSHQNVAVLRNNVVISGGAVQSSVHSSVTQSYESHSVLSPVHPHQHGSPAEHQGAAQVGVSVPHVHEATQAGVFVTECAAITERGNASPAMCSVPVYSPQPG